MRNLLLARNQSYASPNSLVCQIMFFSVPLEFRGLLCFAFPQLYKQMCWIASNLIERKGKERKGKERKVRRREEEGKTKGKEEDMRRKGRRKKRKGKENARKRN